VTFVNVLMGENESIMRDYAKHYRSDILHVLDFSYQSLRDFRATSWPAYVLADASGEIIVQTIGMGRGSTEVDKFRRAIDRVCASDGQQEKPKAASVVCENGICVIAPLAGGEARVRETSPCLATAPDGVLWLAYCSNHEGDNNIYLKRCTPGTPGEPMAVTRSTADDYAPALAVGPDGCVWVAWASNRTGKYDIYLRSFDGKSWSSEYRVTTSDDDAMRPATVVDADGRVWVTYYKWNRNFGTSRDRDVFARWLHDGKWSDELLVSPAEPAIEDHADPAIAADPEVGGRVWIAWSYDYHPQLFDKPEDTDQPSIFARPVGLDGPVGEDLQLVGTRGRHLHAVDLWPTLAFDPDGGLWCAFDYGPLARGGRGTLVARFDGNRFAAPDRILRTDDDFASPRLHIGADGTKLLVWSERIGGCWCIRGVLDTGSGWSQPKEIAASEGDLRAPVTAIQNGRTWVAYEEETDLHSRIRVTQKQF